MWVGGWWYLGQLCLPLVHWNSCDGLGEMTFFSLKPSIVMLNLNPDTNLGTCKLSVCTPGVRTHWCSPLWDPEISNWCLPSANEVGGCQWLVSSGGWNPYYTGGHSSHCVAKNKNKNKIKSAIKKVDNISQSLVFGSCWYSNLFGF